MIQVRKSGERGHANHGWLNSFHTFSFASYYGPRHTGFRSLRVINEDRVAPGKGFGSHSHRDMEILSYVLKGSLAHRDNMGHEETLGPNEIQRMSAGTGVIHSEFNASAGEPVHFLQIWIEPATTGGPSSYEQIRFAPEDKKGRLKLLASPQGGAGVARINQDARVFVAELTGGDKIDYRLGAERYAWLHVIRGAVTVNGVALEGGDAAALSQEAAVSVEGPGAEPSEVLLFDLA
jgi:redox-sensitive bicupin YhaK (pirin superfamily)